MPFPVSLPLPNLDPFSLLFTPSTPFGPFTHIREYVLANSRPIDSNNWYHLFILSTAPLYVQALLLRYRGTRLYRSAVAVLGIYLLWDAGLHLRFEQPWLNALNNGIGIGLMHLTVRYIEFGLIEGPVFDRYFEAKGRHPLISAFDVCVNARWIGLGALDLDHQGRVDAGHPLHGNAKLNSDSLPNGKATSNDGRTIPDARHREKWLPWPKIRRTRFQAVRRHAFIALRNYVLFDTFLSLVRDFGADTIGSTSPVPNAFYRFSHENRFVLFPRLNLGKGLMVAPWWLTEIFAEVGVASGVWLGIAAGYHFLGAILVGSGLWEVESWEVDLFDNPLAADSLLEFWGRRWHQFFRHHFILVSTLFLRLVHLPINSSLILSVSFVLSGAMHALGQFTLDPTPPLFPIFVLFPLSGLGCALEVQFKRLTGRKVRGVWGRVWVWAFMLASGRLGAVAWLESGVGGSYLTPPFAGEYVKDWLKEWVVNKA
ncbi:hypothetical protein I316_03709 [Kwoniella heveanensis BCC8398]|uniref:Wax synthase domain-containing protein n=1 Tax=Kwoniella heveanensis BCC8398 TaxID=1296120 RepID=A0A1B9GUG4_9TREE|nr:hypothetical protein I316_03709 [Kwoniella heveanensis BCC8398]